MAHGLPDPLLLTGSASANDTIHHEVKSMTHSYPEIYLARHGETAWTLTGQHTSFTDIQLTERGEQDARRLAQRLDGVAFAQVLTSPLQRAYRTCELAGFGDLATLDDDLVEWNYGDCEGRTTPETQKEHPGWEIFRGGCAGGESIAQVAARADRVVNRLRGIGADVLVFSHGHFLRVLAARWLGLDASLGRYLFLGTTSLSILGYEHNLDDAVVRLWNECPP